MPRRAHSSHNVTTPNAQAGAFFTQCYHAQCPGGRILHTMLPRPMSRRSHSSHNVTTPNFQAVAFFTQCYHARCPGGAFFTQCYHTQFPGGRILHTMLPHPISRRSHSSHNVTTPNFQAVAFFAQCY